jgi:hypothetical protein
MFYGNTGTASDSVAWRAYDVKLAGLDLWLNADDATSFSLSGSDVNSWNDYNGGGGALSQGTPALKPQRVAGAVNGRAVVRFDGVDDYLQHVSAYGNHHAFVVFKVDSTDQDALEVGQLTGNYGDGVHIGLDPTVGNLQGFSFDGNSTTQLLTL